MSDAARLVPAGVVCLDVGSTWTKAALVAPDGTLLGTSSHVTTPPEVLDGIAATVDHLGAAEVPVLACSSAGGGLRLAVVGQEPMVSAEAGRRVALSAGAKVVHVHAGAMSAADLRAVRDSRPDVLLLVGGTDGGDRRTLLHNAGRLARNRVRVPIVLAGNAAARDDAVALLGATTRTVVVASNVLPDVGELDPTPAREAIRAVFLRHVIGGKGLSRGPRFRRLVRLVTPDAVLVGVGRLAAALADRSGAALVVDVGGATTDVYSAVSEVEDGAERHAVALPPQRRTVEGDLGMRHSAASVVAAAVAERLEPADPDLAAAARWRVEHPGWVPETPADAAVDTRLAALAAVLAVRRHVRAVDGRLGPAGVGLLVLSGGVFRHATAAAVDAVAAALGVDPVLRPFLRHAVVRVDADYVLAPAGLLADAGHREAADRLVLGLAGSPVAE